MNDTPTSLTDARSGQAFEFSHNLEVVNADLARTLERHLSALTEIAEGMEWALGKLVIDCYEFKHTTEEKHSRVGPCPIVEKINKTLADYKAFKEEKG
jgi:hypothetical protein